VKSRRPRARAAASSVLVVLALGSCSKTPAATNTSTAWSVSGGFIRDAQGRAVTLRGAQIAGDQKSAPYIDPKTIADYQRLQSAWGFNSTRFLMVWAAIEPQEGQYDDSYLDQLAERAEWAEQLGLSVIVDMHQDIYGEGFGFDGAPAWACPASYYAGFVPASPWSLSAVNPNVEACTDLFYTDPVTRAHFLEAWRRVAQRLAGIPSVIGFDALNEPEWGTYPITSFEGDRLEPFYEAVVNVVRSEAPQWIAFLEPGASRNLGIPTSLVPFPFGNVVYSPHSYDTTAEQTGLFPAEDVPDIESKIKALQAEAESLNAALWVGEYGGQWNDPNIGLYMGAQYTGTGAVAAGSDLWDDSSGGGYSPVAADGSENIALANAISLPYPSRTAGDPVSYAFDDTTSTFTFVYTPDPTISAPTEIIVPSRVYPLGYSVSCGGCESKITLTGVEIDRPANGTNVTVTLQPASAQ
jgi:endoglycosylceramidase